LLRAEGGAMNVCNDGGSIVTFNDTRGLNEDVLDAGPDEKWQEYCRSREMAERAAAKRASSATARRVHQELAQAYARVSVDADE
jgi:hypothetical protein